ncbi:HesA/MoeB/ThiF family protein [Kineobactrum salinum]|uniref:Thiamine biosynthesis protein ThiF n=1 Tax=Kineobactrum salinum TaxID=2708301 RepID=A0A6C0U010_9GAMM|nr:HesA/MoeB/ThiF family protein [Kineobactrum salinum]QIB65346.1 thiamine biosynthesis protein ThiF [Kineobactrum salinum]
MTGTGLNDREFERYDRQLLLDEVGVAGQLALQRARVLIVGAGGLGCPVGLYLAAAGVGSVGILDGDRIERSNLHRQVAFTDADVGRGKADVLADRLRALNPDISVRGEQAFLGADNAAAQLAATDLVLDCSDNFATRYLINDHCLVLAKPWLFAAVNGFQGSLALFTPGQPCFRCLYPVPPTRGGNCNSNGVLGTVPGLVALQQANLALRQLLGLASDDAPRLLLMDCQLPGLKTLTLATNPGCRCGQFPPDADPSPPQARPQPQYPDLEINWSDWQTLTGQTTALLVDVRSRDEHLADNVGGECLSRAQLHKQIQRQPDLSVGLYCQTGRRSRLMAQTLRAAGAERVYSLRGGIQALR